MAEVRGHDDQSGAEDKLSLPSLRLFGRRKKRRQQAEQTPAAPADAPESRAEPTAADPVEPPPEHTRTLPAVEAEPEEREVAPPPGPAPVHDRDRRPPPGPPPATEPVPTPEAAEPEPVFTSSTTDAAEPEVVSTSSTTEPAETEPTLVEEPHDRPAARDDGGRSVLDAVDRRSDTDVVPAGSPTAPPKETWRERRQHRRAEKQARRQAKEERAPRRRVSLPRLGPYPAAILTGLVVGLVGEALVLGTGRGCEAVRGVGSCGGLGLVALLVILALQVVLGAALLRRFRLTDVPSTSFLGVGVAAVIVLLFFLPVLDSLWMLLVIPLLTAVTMAFSWWLTSNFVERPEDDLRGTRLD